MKPDQLEASKLQQKKLDVVYGIKSIDNFAIQDVDLNKRIVTGFYNTNLYFDSDFDVSLPGSNLKSISERGPNSNAVAKIKHLKNHDWAEIPGKIETLEERTFTYKGHSVSGIYFETKMVNTTLGNDTLINYQEGIYDNHSFGFRYVDIEYIDQEAEKWKSYIDQLINPEDAEKSGFMFLVKEYKMFEGSTVGLGANQLTPYLGVKSGNRDALFIKISERYTLLQKQLKSGLQSDEMMQSFEMQLLQLQQLNKELFAQEPSIKDTLIPDPKEVEGRPTEDTFDIDKAIKEIKFFN